VFQSSVSICFAALFECNGVHRVFIFNGSSSDMIKNSGCQEKSIEGDNERPAHFRRVEWSV